MTGTVHRPELAAGRAKRVREILRELRGWRDELEFGPLRQAYNAACDRLDVLESCLLAGRGEVAALDRERVLGTREEMSQG